MTKLYPNHKKKQPVYRWLIANMMTSSNGNIFRVTGHLCGEFTGPRWVPRTKASDAELWCFFYLRLNKRLRKQPWGWWFETLSHPLWCHCNERDVTPLLMHWDGVPFALGHRHDPSVRHLRCTTAITHLEETRFFLSRNLLQDVVPWVEENVLT